MFKNRIMIISIALLISIFFIEKSVIAMDNIRYLSTPQLDLYTFYSPELQARITISKKFGAICKDPFDADFYIAYSLKNGNVQQLPNAQTLYYNIRAMYKQQKNQLKAKL